MSLFSKSVEQQYNVLELVSTTESTDMRTVATQHSEETIDKIGVVVSNTKSDEISSLQKSTEVESEPTTEAKQETYSAVEELLDTMTLKEKIYQLFIVTPEALVNNQVYCVTKSDNITQTALLEKPVGGIVYFAQNLVNGEQTRNMISDAQMYAKQRNWTLDCSR